MLVQGWGPWGWGRHDVAIRQPAGSRRGRPTYKPQPQVISPRLQPMKTGPLFLVPCYTMSSQVPAVFTGLEAEAV
jgi:hypothetical protein